MQRAASGNHWSQQMPTPITPCCGVPHAKAGVAGVEVVLLGVAGPVGDVALAVGAEHRAVGVDDHDGVEERLAGALVDAQRQDDAELGGDASEVRDRRMAVERDRPGRSARAAVLAEVRPFEQFGDQDDLRALARQRRAPAARRSRRWHRRRRSSPSGGRPRAVRSSMRRYFPSSVSASAALHAASIASSRSAACSRRAAATSTTNRLSNAKVPT